MMEDSPARLAKVMQAAVFAGRARWTAIVMDVMLLLKSWYVLLLCS